MYISLASLWGNKGGKTTVHFPTPSAKIADSAEHKPNRNANGRDKRFIVCERKTIINSCYFRWALCFEPDFLDEL